MQPTLPGEGQNNMRCYRICWYCEEYRLCMCARRAIKSSHVSERIKYSMWINDWLLGIGAILKHYSDVIMGAMASQITSITIVYSTVHSGADQRKHQSSASLTFVRRIHRWPVNSPHKWPVTRKCFHFSDDVIMGSKPQPRIPLNKSKPR